MARGHLIERVRTMRREYYRSISRIRTLETEGVVTRPKLWGPAVVIHVLAFGMFS
jgi:hypothetical protein